MENTNHLNPGPTSDAGKAISSRNAIKHGCCSTETLILATESGEDFTNLEATWFQSYTPQTPAETHLLRQLIEADWFLRRATRTVAEVEAQIITAAPNPLEWTDAHHKTLARFLRYQTTRANLFAKARKAVEDFRKNRAAEAHRTETQATAAVKLEIYKRKNKPKPTFQEEMAELREKAIREGRITPDGKPIIK